jgi:hypothetical protein
MTISRIFLVYCQLAHKDENEHGHEHEHHQHEHTAMNMNMNRVNKKTNMNKDSVPKKKYVVPVKDFVIICSSVPEITYSYVLAVGILLEY